MAGDWVKIEHVTPDKPEVFAIAERHGIDPDAVMGKLVRVWIWADQQTIDGNAPSVTRTLLDRISCVTGFADSLLRVGWLRDENGQITFCNFDRHNGETAKQRALTSKRQGKYRLRKRNAASVTKTLPEKRREENSVVAKATTPPEPDKPARREVSTTEVQAVVTEWNMLGVPFSMVSRISNNRRKAIKNRMADEWWRANWRAGLERVRQSEFCRGGGLQGWVADFEWFVRPETLMKVLEGKYDTRERTAGAGQSARESAAEARQRGNVEAIKGFLRASGVRASDADADCGKANGAIHDAGTAGLALNPGDVPF